MSVSDLSAQVLILNPNSSPSVTRMLDDSVAPFRFPGGPEIRCETLNEGPEAIESEEDVLEVAPRVRDFVACHEAGAFVIACFSDPGLAEARSVSRRPVFGMAECGYAAALTRGSRFGVISILADSLPRHRRHIRALGIDSRLAADLPLGIGMRELNQSNRVASKLRGVGRALIHDHDADVLVLGCAGLAAYRAALEADTGVPVIEPVQAAASFAVAALLTGSAPVKSDRAGSPTANAPPS